MDKEKEVAKKNTRKKTNKNVTKINSEKETKSNLKKNTNSKRNIVKKSVDKKEVFSSKEMEKHIEKSNNKHSVDKSVDVILSDLDKIDEDKTHAIDLVVSDNSYFEEYEEEKVKNNAFNKKSKRKKFFKGKFYLDIFDILIIILITAIISCVVSGAALNYQYKNSNLAISSELKEDKDLSEFISIYSDIKENYYEEIDSGELIKSAIDAMIKHLEDKYSIYFNGESSNDFNNAMDGTYKGIGILASGALVVDVYDDSPAAKAGIEAGDIIIKINDTDITKDNVNKITDLINEKEESTIVVSRNNNEITFSLKADTVTINVTSHRVIEKNNKKIGYLSLASFTSSASEQFSESLIDLEKNNIDSLIIDLRDNSGGYLSVMESIASLFIEKDKTLYGLQTKDDTSYVKDKTEDHREYPIVVLVNNNSASASEMLTASLRESYNAIIVGKTTYGKGTAQKVVHSGNSTAKFTVYKWLTPNGNNIDGVGIKPDYDIDNKTNGNVIVDLQLDKAIEVLSK